MSFCKKTSYKKALEVLTSQGKFYINLGLERVQAVLELLNNPQKALKFVHVAGTNGKGSVCAMLSSILKQKYKVGLFTSPHIFDYTERIKINDAEISRDDFADKVLKIINLADKNEIHLTEFEIITVVAFEYFFQSDVDIVILETGLGGRLDATNIIDDNICSVITHIDLDHTDRLGATINLIAKEKAGIIKQGCPVVVSNDNNGVEIIKYEARCQNAKIVESVGAPIFLQEKLALKGHYQQENLSLVLSVIDVLKNNGFNIDSMSLDKGLIEVQHSCRFEYLSDWNLIVDGAHNPNGAKVLRESLDAKFPNQKIRFIFGCLKNKDYKKMMKNLFSEGDEVYFYQFANSNSCSFEELSKNCDYNSKSFSDFKLNTNILTVICGSFYMIKELLEKMGIK